MKILKSIFTVLFIAFLAIGCNSGGDGSGDNGGSGNTGDIQIPEGLEKTIAAANDPIQTFQVQFSADSASIIRERLTTVFPDIASLISSGTSGRDYMLHFFEGTPTFGEDITLLIYAEALRQMGDVSVVPTLQNFLSDNINGHLIWTPHYVTHTIKSLLGDTDLEASGYYTAQQMQAAASRTISSHFASAVIFPGNRPNCSRQYILVDNFNNPLTYQDSNGQIRQAVVKGTVHASNNVPGTVYDNYIEEVKGKGEGTYVTDDPMYPGEPSKQFNCAGYVFRSFNGNQRWTSDPGNMFEVLYGANLLIEVSESNAQPGDIVFYYKPASDATTLPAHVAEVNRIETGSFIIVRNADGQSGLFDAAIDANYFTGNFFQASRYPTRRVFRWVNGTPPSVIPDPGTDGNEAYCVDEIDVNISADPQSTFVNEWVFFDSTVTGGERPYLYEWDFGDTEMSTNADDTHAYSMTGTFTVKLTVTDANDISAIKTLQIDVQDNSSDYVLYYTDNVRCWGAPWLYLGSREKFNRTEYRCNFPGGGIDCSQELVKTEIQGGFSTPEEAQNWICPKITGWHYSYWCGGSRAHYIVSGQELDFRLGALGCDLTDVPEVSIPDPHPGM